MILNLSGVVMKVEGIILVFIVILVVNEESHAQNASDSTNTSEEPWIPIISNAQDNIVDNPESSEEEWNPIITNELNDSETIDSSQKPWKPIISESDRIKSSQESWNPIIPINDPNETENTISSSQESWTPIVSKEIKPKPSLRNLTLYLGYANNPFGPSKRLHHKKNKMNQTEKLEYRSKKNFSLNNLTSEAGANEIDSDQEAVSQEPRSKRGVIHLYNMVSCATGCNPLIYKGYGCFCGFLGSGFPVDGIDSCCRRHDWCYVRSNCPMFLEYFIPYFWRCYRNRPICALDHGEWGGYGSCSQRLCECDRILSECLSRYPCPSSRALCRSSPWRLLQNTLMIF